MIKRILVGVTGGNASAAKQRFAIDLARRHGARLEILSVVDVDRLAHVGPVPLGGVHYAQRIQDRRIHRSHELADDAIARFEAAGREAGLPVTVHVHEGDPFGVVAREWRFNDLAIFALRDWFDHEAVREPEKTLVRLASSDVWPVIAVPEQTAGPVGKVLVAYDDSLEAADAMKSFAQSGAFAQASCTVVRFGGGESDDAEQLARAEHYLRDHGFACTSEQVAGDVRDGLLPHARAMGADLIVMGCDSRHTLVKRVYSDIALEVIRNSPIPLWLAH